MSDAREGLGDEECGWAARTRFARENWSTGAFATCEFAREWRDAT